MSARFWIFVAAISGGLAVAAGAIGAHALPQSSALVTRIFDAGQLYQALHALALVGVGTLLAATEGRRQRWAGVALQIAAAAFTLGTICFSGGIYVQIAESLTSSGGIVPFGGICLLAGWVALAAGALGLTAPK